MDKIVLRNMKFFGYHGVLEEERKNGQIFFVDVEAYLNLKDAGISDALCDTCDYSEMFEITKNITENNKFRLIERLADEISREILSKNEKIAKIEVRVRKPQVPIDGSLDYAEVQIARSKDGF